MLADSLLLKEMIRVPRWQGTPRDRSSKSVELDNVPVADFDTGKRHENFIN